MITHYANDNLEAEHPEHSRVPHNPEESKETQRNQKIKVRIKEVLHLEAIIWRLDLFKSWLCSVMPDQAVQLNAMEIKVYHA